MTFGLKKTRLFSLKIDNVDTIEWAIWSNQL